MKIESKENPKLREIWKYKFWEVIHEPQRKAAPTEYKRLKREVSG